MDRINAEQKQEMLDLLDRLILQMRNDLTRLLQVRDLVAAEGICNGN